MTPRTPEPLGATVLEGPTTSIGVEHREPFAGLWIYRVRGPSGHWNTVGFGKTYGDCIESARFYMSEAYPSQSNADPLWVEAYKAALLQLPDPETP